jgi:hypothetical protein
MPQDWIRRCFGAVPGLIALGFLLSIESVATTGVSAAGAASTASDYKAKLDHYLKVRREFEEASAAYWNAIADKRRERNRKRRDNEPIGLDDYVLTQPPIYSGPPRPVDPTAPSGAPPERRKAEIPVVADFLKAAFDEFGFKPQKPESEIAFKRAYANIAAAAGLTKEQVVRIYAFETGGNGTYDSQAGLIPPRPGGRAISPAIGYNQLLSTNSVGLMAVHGDHFLAVLRRSAVGPTAGASTAMAHKMEALQRMIAFSRTVPNSWSEHDHLAKNTRGGMGIHAANLDRDIGPLLQTQKLLNSVLFARTKGHKPVLAAVELELMNLTGDGNGFDMVTMPTALRERVPTANFFQQSGYERNPIARRTGVVAGLIAAIGAKMDEASLFKGAKDLAAAF